MPITDRAIAPRPRRRSVARLPHPRPFVVAHDALDPTAAKPQPRHRLIAGRFLLLVCLSLPFGTGCSLLGVQGPPARDQRRGDFACTEASPLPALDATLGVVGFLVSLFAVRSGADPALATGAIGGSGLFLVSGIVGHGRVKDCRTARGR
jgi:hypothetical protein